MRLIGHIAKKGTCLAVVSHTALDTSASKENLSYKRNRNPLKRAKNRGKK